MKLFYAAAAVALAKQASAYRVVLANDNTYCIAVVKNDDNTDFPVDGSGNINGTPTSVVANEDDSPTIAQNGVNDPMGQILLTARTDWAKFITDWAGGPGATPPTSFDNNLFVTIYEAGATTAYASLAGLPDPTGSTLSFCEAYSTMAPDHYCKADGDFDNYQKSTLKTDIQTCCVDNHSSGGMENTCLLVSTGVPARGDAEWYVDYTNNKCIRNCSPDNLFDPNSDTDKYTDTAYSYECGGLKPASDDSWTDIDDCCSNRLTSLQPTYCAYRSELGSSPAPTPAYPGTGKWYADAGNSLCVQDYPVNAAQPTYGGTVTAASTKLYTTAADCCSTSLSWVSGCATRSSAGQGVPTNIFWASPDGCRMDCTGSPNCATAPTSAKLYQTAAECCAKANSWVNKDFCEKRAVSTFDESASTSSGTDLWFVDYEDGVCRKDCYPAGGSSPCDWADNGSMTFYSTSIDCCKGALGSQNQYACVEASDKGKTINTVATDKWYVKSDSDQPCAQDCATGGSNTACGGVIAKTGAKLYDSETECCQQAYAWVDNDLCEKLSLNVAGNTYTNNWYVSYSDNACQQDCDPTAGSPPNPACHGTPSDISTPLYTTPEACCAAKLSWINAGTCKTSSETGASPSSTDSPGAGAWRKNDAWSSCVLDCKDSGTIETGDPILTVQPLLPAPTSAPAPLAVGNPTPDQCDGVVSGATMYGNSVSNCCASISWVQKETCEAISTGVVSEMFFLDPSDSTKCVVQQAANTAGSTIDCDATGEVQNSADADGVTCKEDITVSTKLYSTLQACCDANVSWNSANCVHDSKGTQYQGSGEFYVDWSISKCVKDCPTSTSTGSQCGGLANSWDTKYTSATACCGRLNWIDPSKCQYFVI